jgi:hypothetical protein
MDSLDKAHSLLGNLLNFLNGVPGKKFHYKRGVRQGDPLSPLLFVLAVELLQYLINDSKQNGILTLTIPHGSNDFPIVQYAGDTILIMKADISEVLHLKSLLTTFTASTGLHVNFYKSSMVSINVPDSTMQDLAGAFGCQIM